MSADDRLLICVGSPRAFCMCTPAWPDMSPKSVEFAADVLMVSDLCSIDGHGITHPRCSADNTRGGVAKACPNVGMTAETRVTATVNAGGGSGQSKVVHIIPRTIEEALDASVAYEFEG